MIGKIPYTDEVECTLSYYILCKMLLDCDISSALDLNRLRHTNLNQIHEFSKVLMGYRHVIYGIKH